MYSPYSFNYNITSIVYYRHIDNSLYQKEWDVNVPLLLFYSFPVVCHMLNYRCDIPASAHRQYHSEK